MTLHNLRDFDRQHGLMLHQAVYLDESFRPPREPLRERLAYLFLCIALFALPLGVLLWVLFAIGRAVGVGHP